MFGLRHNYRICLFQEVVRQLARLNIRAVIDEFSNRNLRSEFGQSSKVIAMPMSDDQMIDLLKSRILDGRRDTACIARSRCARISRIDQERFARRRNEKRCVPPFYIDDINLEIL